MKFIHAADIHLDSPLQGLERYDGAPTEELRGATRKALENLVQLAMYEKVNFVLIAGDVYDGDWKDYNTGLFFLKQMSQLREAGIAVFLISGNHDAASQITKELRLPENVKRFSAKKPESVELEDLGVAIHGQSFHTQAVMEDLSAGYPIGKKGIFNIGLLHSSATGREGHENYAPCTVEGLKSKGYDYWALGHIHKREELSRVPWIIFPGNVQGRHVREVGEKGCTLVGVDDHDVTSVEHRSLDVVRWCQCDVESTGARTLDELLERVRRTLLTEKKQAGDRLVAARIRVVGACEAHKHIASSSENLAKFINEIRALATDLSQGEIWIEKVKVETRSAIDLESLRESKDPIGELLHFIASAKQNGPLLQDLALEFKDLQQKLPVELLSGDDAIQLDSAEAVRSVLNDVEQLIVSRLFEKEDRP